MSNPTLETRQRDAAARALQQPHLFQQRSATIMRQLARRIDLGRTPPWLAIAMALIFALATYLVTSNEHFALLGAFAGAIYANALWFTMGLARHRLRDSAPDKANSNSDTTSS